MRQIKLILIIAVASGCRPDNVDFNPFDNEFKFHSNFKLHDYDTIMGECGYWNLTKNDNGLELYYQFFLDEKEIVAKGFKLDLDEIVVSNEDSLISEERVIKLLEQHPIDFESAKQKLKLFNIKKISTSSPVSRYIRVELVDDKDSVYQAHIVTILQPHLITRHLDYFNEKQKRSD